MLFVGDGTDCFAKNTSRDYESKKPSPSLKKFFRQSQSSTPERQKLFQLSNNRVDSPWVDTVKQKITSLFHSLQVYTKPTQFSPFQTPVMSGLSSLDEFQLL